MTFNTHNTNGATLQNTNTNFLSDLNCTNP
jgi:hypothetical protein